MVNLAFLGGFYEVLLGALDRVNANNWKNIARNYSIRIRYRLRRMLAGRGLKGIAGLFVDSALWKSRDKTGQTLRGSLLPDANVLHELVSRSSQLQSSNSAFTKYEV